MSIHEQEQINKFLEDNTFFCKLQKARLSHQACLMQSARAYQRKLESEHMLLQANSATWMKTGDSTLKLQALLHALTATCLRCTKYKEPSKALLSKVEKRGRKRVQFGRLSPHVKNSLPRTPPITNTLS